MNTLETAAATLSYFITFTRSLAAVYTEPRLRFVRFARFSVAKTISIDRENDIDFVRVRVPAKHEWIARQTHSDPSNSLSLKDRRISRDSAGTGEGEVLGPGKSYVSCPVASLPFFSMSRKNGAYVSALLVLLLELTASTVVLPRPPSSLNHIRHDQRELSARKAVQGKSLHGVSRNIDAGRPDTEDYRLLEIELQSAEEMDATNLQGLVRAMLKQQQQQQGEQTPNDSYPNPEVIPHSILGVRDIGLGPNYRVDTFDDDKRVLLSPPKLQSLDEKLYYLKSGRPKVYVNVRGNSGRKGESVSPTATPSEGPAGFLRVTRPFERQTDRKIRDKKAPPKKFDRRVDGIVLENEPVGKVNDQGASYGADDLSTTENSLVTSSELPKQIPAPPSKVRGRVLMVQTTPVQRYALRRTDILPGYSFADE